MSNLTISEAPLLVLFGSKAAYQVLMYLENYENGYASKIANTFDMSLNEVQKQLAKFEDSGLLVSRKREQPECSILKKAPSQTNSVNSYRQCSKYFRNRREKNSTEKEGARDVGVSAR